MIRPYTEKDYDMIVGWHGSSVPNDVMGDGTFILEIDNIPALCLTTLLTQMKGIAYVFAFIKNPIFKESLEEHGQILWNYCFDYAKNAGYKRILCFTNSDKLAAKYERFGMKPTMKNLTSFVREL